MDSSLNNNFPEDPDTIIGKEVIRWKGGGNITGFYSLCFNKSTASMNPNNPARQEYINCDKVAAYGCM